MQSTLNGICGTEIWLLCVDKILVSLIFPFLLVYYFHNLSNQICILHAF
jgi:hypothetical protein